MFLKLLKNKNNRRGFTLIELLVVISIIGLLSTVILASLQNVRRDAKWRKFESELIQIRTAVQLYRENNNGNWPPASFLNQPVSGSYQTSFNFLLSELKSAKLYPNSNIEYPENLDMYITPGYKTIPSSSMKFSCGSANYKDVYYVIYFTKYQSYPFSTKIPEMYYDGQTMFSLDYGYYYCIDFK
jgi:prepilin-type N-terminal cleavage/methylation domain-containing protein